MMLNSNFWAGNKRIL